MTYATSWICTPDIAITGQNDCSVTGTTTDTTANATTSLVASNPIPVDMPFLDTTLAVGLFCGLAWGMIALILKFK